MAESSAQALGSPLSLGGRGHRSPFPAARRGNVTRRRRLPPARLPVPREGKTSWEDLDLDDVDVRLKWAGLFHRRKRTPGRFMMRLKVGARPGCRARVRVR